jgi:putative tricarboxylic transport membrane protein
MLDALISGTQSVFIPSTLGIILLGVVIGMIVGILPGIGGVTTIAIMLPFMVKWDPRVSLCLVISMYAATYSSGLITSILLGIPGEANATATLLDGYPMCQQGKAARAMAAGFMSSMLGGIFGAFVLAALIPVARPIVLSFSSPELFSLSMLGVCFIALLSSRGTVIKSIVMGLLGILAAFVGVFSFTGTPRMTFGFMYLYDGVPLVAVAIGIFAIPELFDMIVGGGIVKVEKVKVELHGVWEGIKDCFRHWRTVLCCSALGAGMGLIPGVGVIATVYLAYGLARLISKQPQEFGLGCVEGVIGPEAADNAKEGGGLITTLVFGLPAGVSMAMVLVILMMSGISPGVEIIVKHLDIVWSLVVALIVSNVMATGIGLATAKYLAKLVYVRMNFLAPIILLLVLVGAYGLNSRIEDVIFAFIVGGVGCLMKKYEFSRVTFIVGFVLGDLIERYFLLSVGTLGPAFLIKKPIALALLLVLIPVFGQRWLKGAYLSWRRRRNTL